VRTKIVRKTLNPVWKETLSIKEFHPRARPAHQQGGALPLAGQAATLVFTLFAHEHTRGEALPLAGQAATLVFTLFANEVTRGADDFIGAAVLRGVRAGPVGEHRLALCDRQGRPVGFSGQTAVLHVRVSYAPGLGDEHQQGPTAVLHVRVSHAPGAGGELMHHQEASRKAAELALVAAAAAEASRKAAELALSRRRRQSGAPDPPLASLSSSLNAQSGMG
ncbi:hypothetical protein T484DRAFT_1829854, partial [Baffinella frigidus]